MKKYILIFSLFDIFCFFFIFQAFALFRLITLNIINHSQIITGIFGYLTVIIGFFRLNQEEYFINSIKVDKFSAYHLRVICSLKIQTLKFIENVSFIYGNALFLYILFNIPTNGAFMMMLIFSKMKLITKLVFVVIILLQLIVLIGVHLFGVYFVVKYHRPIKKIMQFNYQSKQLKNLKDQLKLSFYIEQMHTNNPYALTYGKYGNITFSSFGKHLFYYCKFFIFYFRIFFHK